MIEPPLIERVLIPLIHSMPTGQREFPIRDRQCALAACALLVMTGTLVERFKRTEKVFGNIVPALPTRLTIEG